jgi:hypothetical protein
MGFVSSRWPMKKQQARRLISHIFHFLVEGRTTLLNDLSRTHARMLVLNILLKVLNDVITRGCPLIVGILTRANHKVGGFSLVHF